MTRMLLAVAAALLATLAPAPDAATARVAERDWTATVTQTPTGAFVMGNPKARVKLVEYLSLTCDHCAHFAAEALGPLKSNYIRSGLVSLELRHAIRDPFDIAASLLVRCEGPGGYFAATETVLAKQPEWLQRASELPGEEPGDKPMNERLIAMAKASGLDTLFPPARVGPCLSNPAEHKRLAAMADEAWVKRKIEGTPAFLINGVVQPDVASWDALEPKLKAALK